MVKLIITFILSFGFNVSLFSAYQVIKDKKALEKFSNFPNLVLYISSPIYLHGDTISFARNIKIVIRQNGSISKGTLRGNDTKIDAPKQPVLKDVAICGTWRNQVVYGEWIKWETQSEDDNLFFGSLMALCKGKNQTNLYLQAKKYYVSAISCSAPIIVPSNTYWHNQATIYMKPTSLSKYNMVLLSKVSNVTIDGGCFVGDVENHIGNKGQLGHGFKCSGSSNIILQNFIAERFWGDGLDIIEALDANGQPSIICKHILIKNISCRYNRRQGMSVEAGHHIRVEKCEFTNTGCIKSSAPSSGVDIEPWAKNNDKIVDILFKDCIMKNNKGLDFNCQANLLLIDRYFSLRNKLRIKHCFIGTCRVNKTCDILFYKCIINSPIEIISSDLVTLQHSYLKKISCFHTGTNIILKKCTYK